MQFTYYGHSCFSIIINGKHLLFDPFITYNELASHIDIESIKADYIFISHGHADHIADCISIAKRTNALVICSWEIHEWLNKKEISNTHPMNTGGKKVFDFGTVKCTVAQHSSGLPDGSYGGNPMGFHFITKEKSFYYSGDTALTLDMQLIPAWGKPNFAILPIGDNFTMDYIDAEKAACFVETKVIIGVHYDTFGFIKINTQEAKEYFTSKGKLLLLPTIGETIDV
ncbi:MAG TPA: metal-dependent hydrolase [Chitinophagaceae bacterium]|nr:metal-dependent hydrolase [Chitinophagaceae bacterium]MCC6634855.1 metal-dependent hydrolase [Chitinophagaceae bacterium]HMZ46395.1 metal-dependent hydrolase [Chitinophagaceae bacterium]HNE92924.1 metal-dependent hydrolase [Chitinophagaceae bacterium]HNJ58145.1 metal-dependent hydrolase [Chitinophagaceae bacterium]